MEDLVGGVGERQRDSSTDMDGKITEFESDGTAIETAAAAYMLYKKAREQDLGTEIKFVPARRSQS